MGFRVVDKTFVIFESDLSPLSRSIHPSGVIHACRADPTTTDSIMNDEHVFAWIPNSLKVDRILSHLEKHGFHRSRGIVFIPYSTKENWLKSYPHTPLSLECTEDGRVTCPTEIATPGQEEPVDGESNGVVDETEIVAPGQEEPVDGENNDLVDDSGGGNVRKRKHGCRNGMVGEMPHLSVPERDELHVEIYNYLTWLHKRLAENEEKTATAANEDDEEEKGGENDEVFYKKKKRGKRTMKDKLGVNVPELRGVLDKLESAFHVIPNIKYEQFRIEGEKGGAEAAPEGGPDEAREEAPFLDEALKPALAQLVEARALAGRPRRRCRRKGRPAVRRARSHAGRFEEMLEKLERFREGHGSCLVPIKSDEYPGLGDWVSGLRDKRRKLLRRGIEVEEAGPGQSLTPMMLTAGRIERLNAMGFVWEVMPNVPWEENFRQLVDYFEENGKWPAQHTGRLGGWVQRQRMQYHAKDERFMKTRAPKLNEIGFEWTPKGYFRVSWDEGFRKLMEFGRTHGHFEVPCPAYGEQDEEGAVISRKSDAHKFYKWVESLHQMYSSYKLGRRSGSLTEERVSLLMRHGFKFRDE